MKMFHGIRGNYSKTPNTIISTTLTLESVGEKIRWSKTFNSYANQSLFNFNSTEYLVFLTSTKHEFNLQIWRPRKEAIITKGIQILRGICLSLALPDENLLKAGLAAHGSYLTISQGGQTLYYCGDITQHL